MDPSTDTSFLLVPRLLIELLLASENFVVAVDILSVGEVN
jgi:hypothetical protein